MLSIIINNIINIQHADANNADESRPTRMPANNTPSIDPFQKERYSISTYLHTYFHRLSVNSVFTGTLRMKFRYVDAALLHQESMSVSPCCPLDKRLLLSITTWEWIISAANKADGTPKIANSSLSSRLVWTLHVYLTTVQVYNIHHFLQGPETVRCYTDRPATSCSLLCWSCSPACCGVPVRTTFQAGLCMHTPPFQGRLVYTFHHGNHHFPR